MRRTKTPINEVGCERTVTLHELVMSGGETGTVAVDTIKAVKVGVLKAVQEFVEVYGTISQDNETMDVGAILWVQKKDQVMEMTDMIQGAIKIMEDFITKCDRGEAKSKRTYGAMVEWLDRYTEEVSQ